MYQKLVMHLEKPINIIILVYLRIAFGAVMIYEVWRFFDLDLIHYYYILPKIHFTYTAFEWVKPWSGQGMYWHFYGLGALALLIMTGMLYRISIILFFCGYTYVFLVDKATYQNHYYFICLLSFLMIFLPANQAFSVDALFQPKIASRTAPSWSLWIIRAQIGIVYFFGGIAKLNQDWLVDAQPLKIWLGYVTDFPVMGRYFTEPWAPYLFSYGGLILDLFVVPALLWRRTRWLALLLAIGFHLTNSKLFNIGVFPVLMIALTPIFLPAHWFPWIGFENKQESATQRVVNLSFSFWDKSEFRTYAKPQKYYAPLYGFFAIWFLVQILLPLRHFTTPDNPSWTENGHRFAWHMRLRNKDTRNVFITAYNPQNADTWLIEPRDYLPRTQTRRMLIRPDMIHQFVLAIADEYQAEHGQTIEIYISLEVSLNGRDYQLFLDPNVNFANPDLKPYEQVLPLKD